MAHPPLILASASPRRAELLRQLEVPFQISHASVAELEPEFLTPREIALRNAFHKARAVGRQQQQHLVLGADTIVCLGNAVFGKPADRTEAQRMLSQLQGQAHEVITGVCLLLLNPLKKRLFAVTTTVFFKVLTSQAIENYLAKINPLDKAGAYAIQEHGDLIVERISGSYSNVVGLPLEQLKVELERWDWKFPGTEGRFEPLT